MTEEKLYRCDICNLCTEEKGINKNLAEVKNIMTLFEKITKDKKALAEYLLECCDNPLYECNEDMCDFCELDGPEHECNDDGCLKAIIKGLDSQVD